MTMTKSYNLIEMVNFLQAFYPKRWDMWTRLVSECFNSYNLEAHIYIVWLARNIMECEYNMHLCMLFHDTEVISITDHCGC